MQIKWIGAICIIIGCGGWGFLTAVQHMRRIQFCKQFRSVIEYMECELEYRATALPQLCGQAAERSQGSLRQCLASFTRELEAQISPNLCLCMSYALGKLRTIDEFQRTIMMNFAENLGQFDVSGQIKGLEQVKQNISVMLQSLLENKDSRLRSYQTLGLCAGAALVILLV